jgi:putative aldouronate transport system substrate-binding protein
VYKWDDPDTTIIPFERTPEFQDLIALFEYWQEEGFIRRLNEAEYGVSLNLAFPVKRETIITRSRGPDDRVEIPSMVYPLYPDTKIQRRNPIGNYFFNPGLAFNRKSQDIEKALQFIEWLHKDYEAYLLLMRGIEGKHYELVDGNVRVNQDNYFYNTCMNVFYDPELAGRMSSPENEEEARKYAAIREKYKELYKRSEYPPHQGFYPDYSKVQSAADTRQRIVQTIIWSPLSNVSYDSVLAEARLSGIKRLTDDIVTEVQRQLDEWMKQ